LGSREGNTLHCTQDRPRDSRTSVPPSYGQVIYGCMTLCCTEKGPTRESLAFPRATIVVCSMALCRLGVYRVLGTLVVIQVNQVNQRYIRCPLVQYQKNTLNEKHLSDSMVLGITLRILGTLRPPYPPWRVFFLKCRLIRGLPIISSLVSFLVATREDIRRG
jgi:hypothetical protein